MTVSESRSINNAHVQKAAGAAFVAGLVLNTILVAIALIWGSSKEMWGALVGMALALVITIPALVTAFWGIKGGFAQLASSVLGGWLIKMAVVIITVILLRDQAWLSMPWAGVGLLVGAVIPTLVEIWILARSRPKLEV